MTAVETTAQAKLWALIGGAVGAIAFNLIFTGTGSITSVVTISLTGAIVGYGLGACVYAIKRLCPSA
jgi:outer membrane lipoprotein SlyB